MAFEVLLQQLKGGNAYADLKGPLVFIVLKAPGNDALVKLCTRKDGFVGAYVAGKDPRAEGAKPRGYYWNLDGRKYEAFFTAERLLADKLSKEEIEAALVAVELDGFGERIALKLPKAQPGEMRVFDAGPLGFVADADTRKKLLAMVGGVSAAALAELEKAKEGLWRKSAVLEPQITDVQGDDWSVAPIFLTRSGDLFALEKSKVTAAPSPADPEKHAKQVADIRGAIEGIGAGPLTPQDEQEWTRLETFVRARMGAGAGALLEELRLIRDKGPHSGPARVTAAVIYAVIHDAVHNHRLFNDSSHGRELRDKFMPAMKEGRIGVSVEDLTGASAVYNRTYDYVGVPPGVIKLDDTPAGMWGRSLVIHESMHATHDIGKDSYSRNETEWIAHGAGMDYILHESGAATEKAPGKGSVLDIEKLSKLLNLDGPYGKTVADTVIDSFRLQEEFCEAAIRNIERGLASQNGSASGITSAQEIADSLAAILDEPGGPRLNAPAVRRDAKGRYYRKNDRHDLASGSCTAGCKDNAGAIYFEDLYGRAVVLGAKQWDKQASDDSKAAYKAWVAACKKVGMVHDLEKCCELMAKQFSQPYLRDGANKRRQNVGQALECDWHEDDKHGVKKALEKKGLGSLFDSLFWGHHEKSDKVKDAVVDALGRAARARSKGAAEQPSAQALFPFASGHETHAFDLVLAGARIEAWAKALPKGLSQRFNTEGCRVSLRSYSGKGDSKDAARARIEAVKAALARALPQAEIKAEVVEKSFTPAAPPAEASCPLPVVEVIDDARSKLEEKANALAPWADHVVEVRVFTSIGTHAVATAPFARASLVANHVPQSGTFVMVLVSPAKEVTL